MNSGAGGQESFYLAQLLGGHREASVCPSPQMLMVTGGKMHLFQE